MTRVAPKPDWPAFARSVIAARLANETRAVPPPPHEAAPHGGAFVTLRRFAQLRGCVGTLDADLALAEAIRQASLSAAFKDQRFSPLIMSELNDVRIEVSVLSCPTPMRDINELILGTHGIVVQSGAQRGLFLPRVATDHGLMAQAFLERCCTEKAGLPADAWQQPQTDVLLFTTEVFAEHD